MQDFPVLDMAVLDRLKADVGEESASFLIDSLKKEIVDNGEALENFLQEEDWEHLEIQAHALKSAARSFGAMQLGEACLALEMGVKNGIAHKELTSLITCFKQTCQETLDAYDNL